MSGYQTAPIGYGEGYNPNPTYGQTQQPYTNPAYNYNYGTGHRPTASNPENKPFDPNKPVPGQVLPTGQIYNENLPKLKDNQLNSIKKKPIKTDELDPMIQKVRIRKDTIDPSKTIVKVSISQFQLIAGRSDTRLEEIKKMTQADISYIQPDEDSCVVEFIVSQGEEGQPTSVTNAIWMMNIALNAYCKREVSLAPFDPRRPLQEAVVSGKYGEPPGIKEAEINKSHASHADAWGASNGVDFEEELQSFLEEDS